MKKVSIGIKLTISLILLSFAASAQQDAQFSQYMFNMLYINPAYSGYKENLYLHTAARSQWVGIDGAPRTMSLAADWSPGEKSGLGLVLQYDKLGAQSSMSTFVNYSYKLKFNNDAALAFGLGFGFVQLGIDGTKLNPVDIDDNYIASQMQKTILPDARAGLLYTDRKFYLAFSVDNMVSHYTNLSKEGFSLLPRPSQHLYFNGGLLLPIGDMNLRPSFLVKDDLKGPESLDLSVFLFLNDRFSLGSFYRTAVKLYNKSNLQEDLYKRNSMGILTEFFATEALRIGYSFDYSFTKIGNYSYGSHEISLGYILMKEKGGKLKCFF